MHRKIRGDACSGGHMRGTVETLGMFVTDHPFRAGANLHVLGNNFLKGRDDSATLSSRKVQLASTACFTPLLCKTFKWWVRHILCLKLDEYAVSLRGAQYSLLMTSVYPR
jgi:hypothetical protein